MSKRRKKISSKDLLKNRRLSSVELQIFTYLRDRKMSVKSIHSAFRGIASEWTINQISMASPFLNLENGMVTALDQGYLADITYNFNPDSPQAQLFLSGQSASNGTGKKAKDVSLSGIYELGIKVVQQGVGKWKLDIKKIDVKTGIIHTRKLSGNPLEDEGTYPEQWHQTES